MQLDEALVTRVILEASLRELMEYAESDVIVVGGGPSGLTAAYYLAKGGAKTLLIERRLSLGGGIGGGGMLMHKVVVEEWALDILDEVGVKPEPSSVKGLYLVDAAALIAGLAKAAVDAGAKIILGLEAVDLVARRVSNEWRVEGVMVLWSAVTEAGLHVDPLMLRARYVVDATGHEARLARIASEKLGAARVVGEGPAWVEEGEKLVVNAVTEVVPGLFVTGMAASALRGYPRMGPVFGGMLVSGRRVAEEVLKRLGRGH